MFHFSEKSLFRSKKKKRKRILHGGNFDVSFFRKISFSVKKEKKKKKKKKKRCMSFSFFFFHFSPSQ